jgi:tRNA nucleotidyltransferase (CCA-adding enzyme)
VEQFVEKLDRTLLEALAGGRVYAVGGRVRDEVLEELGRPSPFKQDLDYLVTGLTFDEVMRRLAEVGNAELVGASFGVIKFTLDGRTVDVALPRRERSIGPHHRDFDVEASPSISLAEDLSRRDFRVNMMARSLENREVIDPYLGRADLEHGRLDVLREQAFVEDPLRVLRGAHFAARFGLKPTPGTIAGMRLAADLVPTVAAERVAEELMKLLVRSPKPSVGFELLREVSALHHILPELLEGWQVEQNEYHRYSVYEHGLVCCDFAPPDLVLRLAALLHDIGKPRTKDGPHFYRHEFVGEEMARNALMRLRFPHDIVDGVCHLIANHMYNSEDSLTDKAIRRFIKRVGAERVEDAFRLRRADVEASGLPPRDPGQQQRFEERVHQQIVLAPPFDVRDLAVNGADVKAVMAELGLVGDDFEGDARVGAALKHCLEQVLDDPQKNDRAVLRGIVRDYFASTG